MKIKLLKLNINKMKRTIYTILVAISLIFLYNDILLSQSVEVSAENLVIESANSLTFDCYIKNSGATAWQYMNGTYVWNFYNAVLNGGTGSIAIVGGSSQLLVGYQPPTVAITGTAPNMIIRTSSNSNGTSGNTLNPNDRVRVATFRLSTSAASFAAVGAVLTFKQTATPYTRINRNNGGSPSEFIGSNKTYIEIPDTPLPIQLASFTGNVLNKRDVKLTWKTSQETNNHGFDVERKSVNGQWSKVAFVSGKGNSNVAVTYNYEDMKLNTGKYNYRLKQIDNNGNFEYFELTASIEVGVPTNFDISQNYPNPFNPTTKIDFDLPFDSKVNIILYDISGREVKTLVNETRTAGYHTVAFNASDLSSGTYFYRIITKSAGKDFVATKKMMLVK